MLATYIANIVDFEQLFHSDCNITNGTCKGVGECEGVRVSVCPVSGINSHNSQERPSQLLATVWHHTHPY